METLEEKINFLINNNLGDSIRLNELLNRVKSGKQIYSSDINYVERLSPINDSKTEEIKPDVSTPTSIKNSEPKKKIIVKNLPDVRRPFAVSYNTSYRDEVKIHKNTCHNYQRSSQMGAVKWSYVNSLKDAVSTVEKLYSKYGDWKSPRCCMYKGALYFECKNCKRYSEDFNNTEKLHSKRWQISSILLMILPFLIVLSGVQPRLNGLNILLIIIGLVILAIENYRAPLVCKNCLSKNWEDHFVYRQI